MIYKLIKFLQKKYFLQPLTSPKVELGKNLKFGDIHYFEFNPEMKKLVIGDDIKFYPQVNLTIGKDAFLFIGKNTTINKYTSIVALKGISIGESCLIGENVKIYDNNHKIDTIDGVIFPNHKEFNTDEIVIGNNVWLTSNVTVLKGVTIGDNSIIGSGCIIYKDIPANSVVKNKTEVRIDIA